jgi:hypothetical protein
MTVRNVTVTRPPPPGSTFRYNELVSHVLYSVTSEYKIDPGSAWQRRRIYMYYANVNVNDVLYEQSEDGLIFDFVTSKLCIATETSGDLYGKLLMEKLLHVNHS